MSTESPLVSKLPQEPASVGDKVSPAAIAIFSGLELMLRTFDLTRHLAENAKKNPLPATPTSLQVYEKALSRSERLEVEKAVEDLFSSRKSKLDEAFKTVASEATEPDRETYPPSEEQFAAIFRMVLNETESKLADEFLRQFGDNPGQTAYAVALFTRGNKEEVSPLVGRAHLPIQMRAFEDFLGALVRMALMKDSSGLGDLPDIPFEVYQRYGANVSSGDVLRWSIDQRVAEFIRSGPVEWRSHIARWASIDVTTYASWDTIEEAWHRRSLYARSSGRADLEYYKGIPERYRPGVTVGIPLNSDAAYVDSFLVEAETIGICLALSWISHFFALETDVFPGLYYRVVRLEEKDRWTQASRICEVATERLDQSHEDYEMGMVNYFYCQQQMGKQDASLLQRIRSLKTSSIEAEVGKLCLLREYGTLSALLRERLVGPGSAARKMYLRDSPLMKRSLKESADVQRAFGVSGSRKKGRGGS